MVITVPDVDAGRCAVGVPRTVVEGVTACSEVVRFRRGVTSGLRRSAGVALIVDRATRADVTCSGRFRPGMVKVPSSGANTTLIVMVGLAVGDHTSSRAGGVCIHRSAAVFAVLVMRSDRRCGSVVVIHPDAVADVSALGNILCVGMSASSGTIISPRSVSRACGCL